MWGALLLMQSASLILTMCLTRRTIDESRKVVELVHADLHEAAEDASRADASDVKMEDAEHGGDASARKHALENGLMSPTGAHVEQSVVGVAGACWCDCHGGGSH